MKIPRVSILLQDPRPKRFVRYLKFRTVLFHIRLLSKVQCALHLTVCKNMVSSFPVFNVRLSKPSKNTNGGSTKKVNDNK